jgi:hypothetical protein
MNGNDMISQYKYHNFQCVLQDMLDSENLDDEERNELEEEQYGCYINSFSLGE